MKNIKNKLVSFLNNYSTVHYNNCTVYNRKSSTESGILNNFSSTSYINNCFGYNSDNTIISINIVNEYNSKLYNISNSSIINIRNFSNSRYIIENHVKQNDIASYVIYQNNGNITLDTTKYKSLINNVTINDNSINDTFDIIKNISNLNWYCLIINQLSNSIKPIEYKYNRNN
jgi:hypothetical protein